MAREKALRIPWLKIPVVLWVAACVFDLASLRLGNDAVRAAFFCISGGLAAAVFIAAGSGLSYNRAPAGNKVLRLTLLHGFVLISILLLFALDAWVRVTWYDASVTPMPAVLLTALGLMFTAFNDFLAGQLVLNGRGTVVRRQQRQ